MHPSTVHQRLFATLIVAGLTACSPTSLVIPPAPTAQPYAPSAPSPTLLMAAASTTLQAPTPVRKAISATVRVGSAPWRMAEGDGFVWVITHGDRSVVRIDPKTNQVVGQPIPAGVQPEALAFGEGALWVATVGWGDLGVPNDIDSVSRIDPETGQLVATIKVSRGPESLAVSPGAVWVVNFGLHADTVSRIDPQTNQIVGEPIVTGRAPLSLAVGEGSVWVANHDARTVTRIDPTTRQVVANIPVPSEPHRVAYGEGAVWVGNWHDNSVSRIDAKSNQVVGEPIPIGFHAGSMAVGHRSVWVTSDYRPDGNPEDVLLVRIDPQTNRAVETIPVGGHPLDVVVTDDAVWVSIQKPDQVLRIEPF